jgi:outer membrane biosynthesis protein TonB
MAEPIEANYEPDGDDWTITVSGRGRQLTAKAPGIIAARDRTDQLAEELAPNEEHRTVVHLLNGDAVEFTTAYLTARLAKTEPEPAEPDEPEAPAEAAVPTPPAEPDEPAKPTEPAQEDNPDKKPVRTPSPRPHAEAPADEVPTT